MGYRSEVGLAITAVALTEVLEGNPELTSKVKECLDYADHHERSEDGNHLFLWDDIKWYSYDEQAALESRLHSIDSDNYRFIRIGEEDSDIETNGGWYDNDFDLSVARSLYYNGGELC